MPQKELRDGYRGSLLGLAIGDAVGTTLEFRAPGSFAPLDDIVGALHGSSKEELLSSSYTPVANYWQQYPLAPEIDEIAAGSFKQRNPPEIRGSGYVVKSLEAAMWAFYHSTLFREGCLLAVNLGDDADTTGAVYGQLAGAFYGVQGIPQPWLTRLAQRGLIESLAEQLFDLAFSH